ncbi:MAG: 4-hydroxy-tetrahydrodipicolinate reductase [Clostridia bacterium]|nr:4-hydroxy-tetrahydrodipicolinate reductase [Clostridia bacterium]
MDILLSGICGHMGKEFFALSNDPACGVTVVAGVDKAPSFGMPVPVFPSFKDVTVGADCIVDFSNHLATEKLTAYAVKTGTPLVIATTGQTEEEKRMIEEASKLIPVFFASNFSIGVALLTELAKSAASVMKDAEIEIVEVHHDRKLDSPSGTALTIADAIREVRPELKNNCGRSGHAAREKDEIGINSVRIGNVVGIHEVIISSGAETITLKHEAGSRSLFARGAAAAARFTVGKEPGLYSMKDMVRI